MKILQETKELSYNGYHSIQETTLMCDEISIFVIRTVRL